MGPNVDAIRTSTTVEARKDFPGRGPGSRLTHFAFDLIGIQQVNENFQAAYVPNGQLARLLHQTEVHQGAKGENSGCLVTTLVSGRKFNRTKKFSYD